MWIAVHDSTEREHSQFVITLVRWLYSLASRLPHFDFQSTGIFLPAALRKAPLQVRDGGQRRVPSAQAVLCIGLPIESRIRLRTVHLRQLLELRGSLVIAILVQVFAAIVVQFLQPFDFFLRTLARFLFPLAFLLLSVTGLLLAVTLLLFLVPSLLGVLRRIRGLHRKCLERTGACDCWRQQQRGDCRPGHACSSG